MSRRLLTAIAAAVAVAAGVLLMTGAGDGGDDGLDYKVVLENAFGLTEGADLRAAGVRVGSVEDLDVQRGTARAIATVVVERPEFAGFETDVRCRVQPQSLIGEYFLDCDPGTSGRPLGDGATVPVEQTAGTIPPDLVQNILRRPYRERLSIILTELGAGFGARGEDLSRSIRNAVPALQQTNRVLGMLAAEREALEDLTEDSAAVVTGLAERRDDVARFISEARDAAQISASRSDDLRSGIRQLPGVLRELRPTLRDLGTAAERQTPALRDLRIASPSLTSLLRDLGPFARAAGPAIEALGDAARTGRGAVRTARSTVAELRTLASTAKDPVKNGRFILEHVDDRDNAVEPNKLAPDPAKGYTGLEAFLNYLFVQTQAINVFDERGYFLKLNLLYNECSRYASAITVRENPALRKQCSAALGPDAIGIDYDVNPRGGPQTTGPARAQRGSGPRRDRTPGTPAPEAKPAPEVSQPSRPAPEAPAAPGSPLQAPVQSVGRAAEELLDYLLRP